MRYAFIRAESATSSIRRLCDLFDVHPSGYYTWLRQSRSKRDIADTRLTGLIKQFWLESGGIYGYRKVYSDLRELGEGCGENRVYRLMRIAGLRAQVGYRRPRHRSGPPNVVVPNRLQRQFNTATPNEAWVTDITYIRTHEGWLYLAVVVDLFSRRVIGWSMKSRITKELVLDALLMAVWRRNPKAQVMVHSDQGSQYTSYDWQSFLREHGLEGSMSRRGNCHDNAVAESFFQLLKRERVRRHVYATREEARSDVFDYIEMFYNARRRHGFNNQLSPVEYEEQYEKRLAALVPKPRVNLTRFHGVFSPHSKLREYVVPQHPVEEQENPKPKAYSRPSRVRMGAAAQACIRHRNREMREVWWTRSDHCIY